MSLIARANKSARFAWERKSLENTKYKHSEIFLADDNSAVLKVKITGPIGSPYQDGTFEVDVSIPPEYPFKEPEIVYQTKIWHPNVEFDTGRAALLTWTCTRSLHDVINTVLTQLERPCLDLCLNMAAGQQLKVSKSDFINTAKISTMNYALGSPARCDVDRAHETRIRDLLTRFTSPLYNGTTDPDMTPAREMKTAAPQPFDPLEFRMLWAPDPPPPGAARTVRVEPGTAEHAAVAARLAGAVDAGGGLLEVLRVENPGQLDAFEARARAVVGALVSESAGGRAAVWAFRGAATAGEAALAALDPVIGLRYAGWAAGAPGPGKAHIGHGMQGDGIYLDLMAADAIKRVAASAADSAAAAAAEAAAEAAAAMRLDEDRGSDASTTRSARLRMRAAGLRGPRVKDRAPYSAASCPGCRGSICGPRAASVAKAGDGGETAALLLSAVLVGRMGEGRARDAGPPVGKHCMVDDELSPTVFVVPVRRLGEIRKGGRGESGEWQHRER